MGDMIDPGWAMGLAATLLNSLKEVLTYLSTGGDLHAEWDV